MALASTERRRDILDAARTLFASKGYQATNIADVADRLKMGHGTFYRYFKNKRDIFSHVIDEIVAASPRSRSPRRRCNPPGFTSSAPR